MHPIHSPLPTAQARVLKSASNENSPATEVAGLSRNDFKTRRVTSAVDDLGRLTRGELLADRVHGFHQIVDRLIDGGALLVQADELLF